MSQWGNPLKAIPEWRKLVASRYPVAMTLLPSALQNRQYRKLGWLAWPTASSVHEIVLRGGLLPPRPSPFKLHILKDLAERWSNTGAWMPTARVRLKACTAR